MTCVPGASDDVVILALPPVIVLVPSNVVPSKKLTVPVAPAGTLDVNVTGLPTGAGFCEEVPVTGGVPPIPGVDLLTICERTAEEAPL
jgi:hypothetical protein